MTMSSIQYFWLILLLRTVKYSKPCVDVVFVLDGSASVKQHFQNLAAKQSFLNGCDILSINLRDSEEVQQNVANLVDKPNVQLFVATASKPYNVQGLLVLVGNDSSHIVTNASFLNISRKILKPYSECLDSRTDFIRKKITSLPTATNNTFSTLSFATAATKHRINRLFPISSLYKRCVYSCSNIHFCRLINFHREAKLSQDLGPESGTLSEFVFRQVRFASTLPIKPVDAAAQSLVSTMTTKSILTKLNIKPDLGRTPAYHHISHPQFSRWPRYIILARNEHLRYFISVKHITSEGAIKDLHQAPSNGGTIRTGEAICYAVHEFNEKFGARKGARKMMDNPIKASQLAHSKGIELKALSVADENVPPDTEQIISITGNPSDTYSTKDFKKLQSVFYEYSRRCKL
ncbi:hypothetical protein X798_03106 [Onchocerca flexuosa]|uniref:VWFA domain-containing protein n=1 Tax=Onchocerca flexuosa TaxID=387005 RepID=A0A238BXD8_9BILA|nr:hypothetical protein X798_03106 [Onchocerca flexuosa]